MTLAESDATWGPSAQQWHKINISDTLVQLAWMQDEKASERCISEGERMRAELILSCWKPMNVSTDKITNHKEAKPKDDKKCRIW